MAAPEKRGTKRQAIEIEVFVSVNNGALIPVITRDVSPTGMYVHMKDPPPKGAPLSVMIKSPVQGERPTVLQGHVARSHSGGFFRGKPGVGIKFLGLTPEAKTFLRDLVKLFAGRKAEGASAQEVSNPGHQSFSRCDLCGWTGNASKWIRKCPKCGGGLA